MTDKDRNQINVQLGPGQMEQLRILSAHYGTVTAAVRVALDALWREFVRDQAAVGGRGQATDSRPEGDAD